LDVIMDETQCASGIARTRQRSLTISFYADARSEINISHEFNPYRFNNVNCALVYM